MRAQTRIDLSTLESPRQPGSGLLLTSDFPLHVQNHNPKSHYPFQVGLVGISALIHSPVAASRIISLPLVSDVCFVRKYFRTAMHIFDEEQQKENAKKDYNNYIKTFWKSDHKAKAEKYKLSDFCLWFHCDHFLSLDRSPGIP